MTSDVAKGIMRGLEQAVAFAKGELAPGDEYRLHIPIDIDVRGIRARLDMTQEEFAQAYGFSVNTVRHWEQGRRVPEGPARAYLRVIGQIPEEARRAYQEATLALQNAKSPFRTYVLRSDTDEPVPVDPKPAAAA